MTATSHCSINLSRAVLTKHRKALYAIRAFWKQLLQQQVSFRGITAAFDKIEERKRLADRAYQTLLERYPANTKVGLRRYLGLLEAGSSGWQPHTLDRPV